jgi:acetyl/propionyl-CoA carboxylase alpha subunit
MCHLLLTEEKQQNDGQFTAVIDGDTADFSAFFDDVSVHVWRGGHNWSYDLPAPSWAASADVALTKGSLVAPMPGRITRILAKKVCFCFCVKKENVHTCCDRVLR